MLSNYTHTHMCVHTYTHTLSLSKKAVSLTLPLCTTTVHKARRCWYGLLPSCPTFQHQGLVWSTTIPSNFFNTRVNWYRLLPKYHPVQLFNTRVWYGLLPFHPTFQHQGQWMEFLETNVLEVCGQKKGEHFRFAPLARPPSPHLIRFVLVGNDVAVNVVLLLEELGVACLQLFRMRRVMPNKVTLHMPQRQRTRSRQGHAKKKKRRAA